MRIISVLLVGVGLFLSSGCVRKTYVVSMSAQSSQGTNYVIIQEKRGKEKIYDCRSMPDGQTWEPTCVPVKFK